MQYGLEEALTQMKKTLFMLATGLAMTAGLASASDIFCGSITSAASLATFRRKIPNCRAEASSISEYGI
jgi:hypothetical protein